MTRCDFPECHEPPAVNGMCATHRNVRVSGSYVKDRHSESSHE